MELLEEISWPKPLEELLEATLEIYRQTHPWIAEAGLSPKSVVRDMFERAMTFGEYIQYYGLARSEGIVLRYLSDAYKALRQTVPPDKANEDLTDLIEWLGEVVRQTDSSLLDEWEELTNPSDRGGRRHRSRSARAGSRLNTQGFPRPGPQRDVPPRRARRLPPLGRAGPTRHRRPAGTPAAGPKPVRRTTPSTTTRRHRPGRPRPGPLHGRGTPRLLGGPADHRRPRRQPRLANHRHRRPRRLRRSRRPSPRDWSPSSLL